MRAPLILLALVLACGCGGGSGSQTGSQPASSSPPAATLTGSYSKTLPALSSGGPHPHKMIAGRWVLFIQQQTAVAFLTNPTNEQFPVAKTVKFSGNRITFGADPNCISQTHPGPGEYTYQVTATKLTLTPVGSDVCHDRQVVLSGAWARTP